MSEPRWLVAARVDHVREGEVIGAIVEGRAIALCRVEGRVFAFDDRCSHGDARLSDGFVIDHCIECPLHQGQFDVRDGTPLCEPVSEPIRVHAVREAGDRIEIAIDGDA